MMLPSSLSAPSIIPLTLNPVYLKGKQSVDSRTPIELSCATSGATIYYTVNGRHPDPFEKWQLNDFVWRYSAPFTLRGGDLRTVKAVAVNERLKSKSVVTTKTFHVAASADSPKQRAPKKKSRKAPNGGGDTWGAIGPRPESEGPIIVTSALQPEEHTFVYVENDVKENVEDSDATPAVESSGIAEHAEGDGVEVKDVVDISTQREDPQSDPAAERVPFDYHDIDVPPSTIEDESKWPERSASLEDQTIQVVATFKDSALSDHQSNDGDVVERADASVQTAFEACDLYDMLPNALSNKQHDKSTQAVVVTSERFSQTDMLNPDPLTKNPTTPPQTRSVETVSKATCTDLKVCSTSCQTWKPEEKVTTERSAQTEQCRTFHGRDSDGRLAKTSPGRGYWRQQIDHITTQLKTEAYNNLDFQELIAEPCLAQINNVKVHEGLDELVLVISMAVQRPRVTN